MDKKILIAAAVVILVLGFFVATGKNNTSEKPASTTSQKKQPPTNTPSASTAASQSPSEAMKNEEQTVTLTSDGFSPQTLTVTVGTKVTWVNKSGEEGNVSSDPHPIHTSYPPLNLHGFASGASVNLVFDKAGTYGYHNHLNPSQTGTVVVK